jgi:hypothetical protein
VGLEAALESTSDATRYRITQLNAQRLSSQVLGNNSTEIDREHPTAVIEVTPEASHIVFDLTALFGPLPGTEDGEVGFEMWSSDERLVLDTRKYAAVQDANPEVDLGPFAPGLAYVDLEAASIDSPDLATAITGGAVPDLAALATALPAVLDDVEPEGSTYRGTALYGDLMGAMGADVEQIARSAAAGVALNLRADPEVLTEIYTDFYRDVESDVTIEVEDGLLRSLRYEVELSGVFDELFDHTEDLGLDFSEADIDQARDMFADTEWELESLLEFEVVEDLQVEDPPTATEDRTDELVEFMESAGF